MRTRHFTIDKQQKIAFNLTVVRTIFERRSRIWHPISSNQINEFDAIQKRAVIWINGHQFDHYTDAEYLTELGEISKISPKVKFDTLQHDYKCYNTN